MEFIDYLKEWYEICANVRIALKTSNLEETIPWNQPIDQQKPEDMAKTLLYWIGHTVEKHHRRKTRSLQIRLDYPNRNKTYYIGTKGNLTRIIVEYIHAAPYSPDQVAHSWKPNLYVNDLTAAEIRNSIERADHLRAMTERRYDEIPALPSLSTDTLEKIFNEIQNECNRNPGEKNKEERVDTITEEQKQILSMYAANVHAKTETMAERSQSPFQ